MLGDQLKAVNDTLVFTGHKLEFYIPESYGTKTEGGSFLELMGDSIKVFGLFPIRTFDAKGKPNKLETLSLPCMITIYNTELERKELQLLPDGKSEVYNVITFTTNSNVMSKYVIADSLNAEKFVDMMLKGKIPSTIPYDKVLEIWHSNNRLNNMNLGIPSIVLEIIINKIYRDAKNNDIEFAKTIGKNPKISQYDYKAVNIREICARTSTFSAITFEDMDNMITTSLNNKGNAKEEAVSPIESIIKM